MYAKEGHTLERKIAFTCQGLEKLTFQRHPLIGKLLSLNTKFQCPIKSKGIINSIDMAG